MTANLTQIDNEILQWEAICTMTRYGRYATNIEGKAIVRANSLVSSPTIALDIGCEGGRWSKLLSDFGWQLICTDIDQNSLDICQKRIPTATCICVSPDDTKLPCDTESIGLALCIQVPSVIHADWFMEESFRVLQKGGLLIGVIWNRLSWRGMIYHSIPDLRVVKGSGQWYWYPFPYAAWRKKFCDKGFTMIYEEGHCWGPFRRNSDNILVPVAAQIERYLGLRKLVSLSPLIVFIAQKD